MPVPTLFKGAAEVQCLKQKSRPNGRLFRKCSDFLALTGFEARLSLVDHVDTAFAAYHAAITMPVLQRAERVLDFHRTLQSVAARNGRQCLRVPSSVAGRGGEFMVGDTRIELVTPSMSTKCSTAELIAHET